MSWLDDVCTQYDHRALPLPLKRTTPKSGPYSGVTLLKIVSGVDSVDSRIRGCGSVMELQLNKEKPNPNPTVRMNVATALGECNVMSQTHLTLA